MAKKSRVEINKDNILKNEFEYNCVIMSSRLVPDVLKEAFANAIKRTVDKHKANVDKKSIAYANKKSKELIKDLNKIGR